MVFASSKVHPCFATTRSLRGVINSLSGLVRDSSPRKSTSLDVTIPCRMPPSFPVSVMGIPEKPCVFFITLRSYSVFSGFMHTGSMINPCLYFLTLRTSSVCTSMELLWWMIPTPPVSAMAMAMLDSVMVSMGLLTKGAFSVMRRVRAEVRSTSAAVKLM